MAFLTERPDTGLVRVQGAEAATFLHGYVSHDMKQLRPGQLRPAAVTTWKGSMLDLVLALRDDAGFLLVTSPGQGGRVRHAIARYLVNVKAELIEPAPLTAWHLVGDDAELALPSCGLAAPVAPDFATHGELRVLPAAPIPGWLLLAPAGDPALAALRAQVEVRDAAAYEAWRVATGIPAAPELGAATNPWEARLGAAVSMQKGCYLGQEVIARLANYHKVQRALMGLDLTGPAAPGDPIRVGEVVVGAVTSVASQQALALVKRDAAPAGTAVLVGEGRQAAVVGDRPFWVDQRAGGQEP